MVRGISAAAIFTLVLLLAGCAGNGTLSNPESTPVGTTGTADGNPLDAESETAKPEPVRIQETHDLSQNAVDLDWEFKIGPGMKEGHVRYRLEALAVAGESHATATDDACFAYVVEHIKEGRSGSQCTSDDTPVPSNVHVGSGVALYEDEASNMASGSQYRFTFSASRSAANLVVDILVDY